MTQGAMTACTVVQAVVQTNCQVNRNGKFRPHTTSKLRNWF